MTNESHRTTPPRIRWPSRVLLALVAILIVEVASRFLGVGAGAGLFWRMWSQTADRPGRCREAIDVVAGVLEPNNLTAQDQRQRLLREYPLQRTDVGSKCILIVRTSGMRDYLFGRSGGYEGCGLRYVVSSDSLSIEQVETLRGFWCLL